MEKCDTCNKAIVKELSKTVTDYLIDNKINVKHYCLEHGPKIVKEAILKQGEL